MRRGDRCRTKPKREGLVGTKAIEAGINAGGRWGYGANGPFYQLAAVFYEAVTGRGAGMDRVWWLH
jgi:hypothetical protein